MTLTKAHIVDAVAEQNGYTKERSFKVVESLLEIIKSTLEYGEDIMIGGFGKFRVKKKKERMGNGWNVPSLFHIVIELSATGKPSKSAL